LYCGTASDIRVPKKPATMIQIAVPAFTAETLQRNK
jgi:hypothetical protein